MILPSNYQACLSIEESRLVLVRDDETVSVASIDRGILFILARWSGSSQLAFRALNKALASFPHLSNLCLFVADTDSDKTEDIMRELGDIPGGAGETYWLLEGRVHCKLSAYNDDALAKLMHNIRDILPSEKL